MSHQIVDIEIDGPLLRVPRDVLEQKCAAVIRRQGRPVGFLFPEQLTAWVGKRVPTRLVATGHRGCEPGVNESGDASGLPPLKPLPTVTIAICTRNRPQQLARCLASLAGITMPEGLPPTHLDILVVDNAPSNDDTKGVVSRHPGVRYTREAKPGLDFARNRAWREATGSVVAYVDDDVVVDRGWLLGLFDAYRECPGAAAFTGQVLPYRLDTEAQVLLERGGGFRKGFERIVFGDKMPSVSWYPIPAVKFGVGANMAFARDVLERIGGFDEALDTGRPLPGGGDLDIFYRVIRAGYSLVYEPRYLVFHEHRRDISALRRQYYGWGLSYMAYLTKIFRTDRVEWKKKMSLLAWWVGWRFALLCRGLGGRKESRPDFILAELAGAARGLCGEYNRSVRRVQKIRNAY